MGNKFSEHELIIGLLVILVKYLVKSLTTKEFILVNEAENYFTGKEK
jgi:hypothetical protein